MLVLVCPLQNLEKRTKMSHDYDTSHVQPHLVVILAILVIVLAILYNTTKLIVSLFNVADTAKNQAQSDTVHSNTD
jgi:hypothetical protein